MRLVVRFVMFGLLIGLLGAGALRAQTPTGAITGTVTDTSGAVIPGAQVVATNVATNVSTTTKSNSLGDFFFLQLPPATYRVQVEAAGFQKYIHDGIVLNVAEKPVIIVVLQPGAVTQTVQVRAAAPLLESQTSDVGQMVTRQLVDNLPLNGRSVFALQWLSNGVSPTNGNYTGYNASYINGGMQGTNDILLDGAPNTISENTAGTLAPVREPPLDSIQEFKLITNGMSAEYGNSTGGVITMVSRSGTNKLHGSLFEFLRNSVLNATEFFTNASGAKKNGTKLNQFGGSVGGPIKRDRTFFFFDYQGDRDRTLDNMLTTVPTMAMRTGDFSALGVTIYNPFSLTPPLDVLAQSNPLYNLYSYRGGNPACAAAVPGSKTGSPRVPFPNAIIPPACMDPVGSAVVKYYPAPNRPGLFNNYFDSGNDAYTNNTWDVKIDHIFNEKQRAFLHYGLQRDLDSPPNHFHNIADPDYGPLVDHNQHATYSHTYTYGPSSLLTAQFSFSRNYPDRGVIDPGLKTFTMESLGYSGIVASLGDNSLPHYFPAFNIAGYSTLGTATYSAYRNAAEVYSVQATLNRVIGSHNLKIGYNGRMYRDNGGQPGYPSGVYDIFGPEYTSGPYPWWGGGSAIADLLIGGTGWRGWSAPIYTSTQSFMHSGFIQDDWKVSAKLTLNMGLRYDLVIPRTERHNRASYWDGSLPINEHVDPSLLSTLETQLGQSLPNLSNMVGGLAFPGVNGSSRRQFAINWNDFAPRLGFALQAAPKTVIRGAAGIMYGPSYHSATGPGGYGTDGFAIYWTGSDPCFYNPNGNDEPLYTASQPFPYGIGPITGSSQGALTSFGGTFSGTAYHNQPDPYNIDWNFGIERELTGNLLVAASYVGSHGLHWASTYFDNMNTLSVPDFDAAIAKWGQSYDYPQFTNPFFSLVGPGGPLMNPMSPYFYPLVSAETLTARYPQFGGPNIAFPLNGNSIYHSFQLRIEKRMSNGLAFQLSYTNSKLIDNAEGPWGWEGSHGNLQDILDLKHERSVSSNDIPQRLVAYYIYQLPFGRGRKFLSDAHPLLNGFVGGWQTQGIYTFSEGIPVAWSQASYQFNRFLLDGRPNKTCNGLLNGRVEDRLNEYFNTSCFTTPPALTYGNAPRTDPHIRWPNLTNMDFSMFKEFPLREESKLQFRVEFFNLTNTPYFSGPGSDLTSADYFGVINSTNGPPRQIQLALRLVF